MELTRLKRESAVEAVYQTLRGAILSSLIRPGERLHVEDLAAKLGVSLTPVRNAIQQLAAEGLIEIRPRSGTFVASLTRQDVEETFEIRLALECLAARKAMAHIGPSEVKRFKDLLRSLRRTPRTPEEREAHDRENSELHSTLVRAAGNRRLLEAYEALNAHLKIARIHASERDWPSRLREEQDEHEAIVAAIEKQDAAELCRTLEIHITRAKEALVAALPR